MKSLSILIPLALLLASCTSSSPKVARETASAECASNNQICRGIYDAISGGETCDSLCQAIRMGLSDKTSLDDCKFKSSNAMWCYSIKRAVFDRSCSTVTADNWTVPELCNDLKTVLTGRECQPYSGSECTYFRKAGYSMELIKKLNSK